MNRERFHLPGDSTENPATAPGAPARENQETGKRQAPDRRFRRAMATRWDEAEFRSSEENSSKSSDEWLVVSASGCAIEKDEGIEPLVTSHRLLTLLGARLGQG